MGFYINYEEFKVESHAQAFRKPIKFYINYEEFKVVNNNLFPTNSTCFILTMRNLKYVQNKELAAIWKVLY